MTQRGLENTKNIKNSKRRGKAFVTEKGKSEKNQLIRRTSARGIQEAGTGGDKRPQEDRKK